MSQTFKCDKCNKNFSTNSNLERHILNIHNNEKNFKCEFCDFKCHQKLNLNKHSCYVKKANPLISSDIEGSNYSIEYHIQSKLELELNGRPKTCPFGRIDVLTETEIIEIKKWEEHKKAIGQILGYSCYYPDHQKRIHFFGIKPNERQLNSIKEVCNKFNIIISEEL